MSGAFILDTFTDAAGTPLRQHRPDIGNAWIAHPAAGAYDELLITGAGRARGGPRAVNAPIGLYYNNAAPTSSSYDIYIDIFATDGRITTTGLAGYIDPVRLNCYYVTTARSAFNIYKCVDGVSTQVESLYGLPANVEPQYDAKTNAGMIAGMTYTLHLQLRPGSQLLELSLDHGKSWPYSVRASDTSIAGPGFAGIHSRINGVLTDLSGAHLDNFVAVDSTTSQVLVLPSAAANGGAPYEARGYNTAWTAGTPGSPAFTLANASGTVASLVSQVVLSARYATLGVTAATSRGQFTISDGVSTSPSVAVTPLPSTIPVNDRNVRFSPYNWLVQGSSYAMTNNPGAYATIGFSGKTLGMTIDVASLVAASVPAHSYPYLRVSVDSAPWYEFQLTANSGFINLTPLGLAEGNHVAYLEVRSTTTFLDRWLKPASAIKILGFIAVSAATVVLPPLKPNTAIVFGDSICEGTDVLQLPDNTAVNDARATWNFALMCELQCEYGLVAFGGQSWTKIEHSSKVPPLFTPGDDTLSSWNKLWAGQPRPLRPAPTFVFCNMGRNDTPGDLVLQRSVQGWLRAARATWPRAKIIMVLPFNAITTHPYIINAIAAMRDPQVYTVNLGQIGRMANAGDQANLGSAPSFDSVDGVHPNAGRQAVLAAMVADALRRQLSRGHATLTAQSLVPRTVPAGSTA